MLWPHMNNPRQPSLTLLAEFASVLFRRPSLEKVIRTPVGVVSNDPTAPKFSSITIHDSRNATATAAATYSSSLIGIRGPISKS
jgi:hypothetical protein